MKAWINLFPTESTRSSRKRKLRKTATVVEESTSREHEKIALSSKILDKFKTAIDQDYDGDEPNDMLPYRVEQSDTEQYVFLDDGFIGSGSFGFLYKAIRVRDKKLVAIKIVISPYSKDKVAIDNEINAFSKIAICGEHVICLFDHYVLEDHTRIVLEYINGIDLEKYMEKIPLTSTIGTRQQTILFVGRQDRHDVAKSLIMAFDTLFNTSKVTHQDSKDAGNILWDFIREAPVLIDFGELCSLVEKCTGDARSKTCTKPCGFLGTEYTMPPEFKFLKELRQKEKDHVPLTDAEEKQMEVYPYLLPISFRETIAHDIWSLGVILLRWYTFNNLKLKKFENIYEWSPEKISAQIRLAPAGFAQNILFWMLQQDPENRLKNWQKCVSEAQNINPIAFDTRAYKNLKSIQLKPPSTLAAAENLATTIQSASMPSATIWSLAKLEAKATHYGIDLSRPISEVIALLLKK